MKALFQSKCRQLNRQMHLVLQGCFIILHACITIQQHRVLTGSSIQLYWHSGTVVLLHNFITLVLYLFIFFLCCNGEKQC